MEWDGMKSDQMRSDHIEKTSSTRVDVVGDFGLLLLGNNSHSYFNYDHHGRCVCFCVPIYTCGVERKRRNSSRVGWIDYPFDPHGAFFFLKS